MDARERALIGGGAAHVGHTLGLIRRRIAGADVDNKSLARAGDAAADEVECISDVRGSAAYKRELVRVFVARALRQALDGNGAAH